MQNMATFYRFQHLMLSEHLCCKTMTKPVCNRKAAAQALPHLYYKEFRLDRIFSVISVSCQGKEHYRPLSKQQSVRAGVQDQRTARRNAGFGLVDIMCNQSKRTCACLSDHVSTGALKYTHYFRTNKSYKNSLLYQEERRSNDHLARRALCTLLHHCENVTKQKIILGDYMSCTHAQSAFSAIRTQ